jgi:hypothetical protein
MKIIKDILQNLGYITSKQIPLLEKDFGHLPVVIKWSHLEREEVRLDRVADRIKEITDSGVDYCREVFFRTEIYRKLVAEQVD